MKKLLLISGKKRTGKDTLAETYMDTGGYVRFGFADRLKEEYKDYMVKIKKIPAELIDCYGDRKESGIGIPDADGNEMTNRKGMQLYGQAMKIIFGINCWVDSVCDGILHDRKLQHECGFDRNYLIADVRFPFEIERVKEILGDTFDIKTIRVKRDTGLVDTHESETAFDDTPDDYFDYVIYNDGTLDEYEEKILNVWMDIHKDDMVDLDG